MSPQFPRGIPPKAYVSLVPILPVRPATIMLREWEMKRQVCLYLGLRFRSTSSSMDARLEHGLTPVQYL